MEGPPTEAVDVARRALCAPDATHDRGALVDAVSAAGFDRETARRAVQRLALDEETTVTAETVRPD